MSEAVDVDPRSRISQAVRITKNEGIINRIKKHFDHPKPMTEPQNKYSRRELFRKAGRIAKLATVGAIAGPLTGVGVLAGADTATAFAEHLRAPQTPTDIFKGDIDVKRGISIRLAPFVPGPREEPNTVEWDDIRFAPSAAADKNHGLYKKDSFKMENPVHIYSGKDGSRWIMWNTFLNRNVLTQPTTLFIKIGPETSSFVKLQPGGQFLKITDTSGGLKAEDGLDYSVRGKVTTSP